MLILANIASTSPGIRRKFGILRGTLPVSPEACLTSPEPEKPNSVPFFSVFVLYKIVIEDIYNTETEKSRTRPFLYPPDHLCAARRNTPRLEKIRPARPTLRATGLVVSWPRLSVQVRGLRFPFFALVLAAERYSQRKIDTETHWRAPASRMANPSSHTPNARQRASLSHTERVRHQIEGRGRRP